MSSLADHRRGAGAGKAVLYVATGTALFSALLAAGWASGSPRVGLVGAILVSLGVWVSWYARSWHRGKRLLLGLLAGLLAAGSLHALISWEIATEVGMLYVAQGDVGLSLALRMGVLLVGFSCLLLSWEMLPFSLVPALALFGLAGGRGIAAVAFGCFLVFLPAALIALAQAMMLSGLPANRRPPQDPRDVARWSYRHWLMIGVLIVAVVLVGSLIYLPAYAYGTQYYWQLAMMDFGGRRQGGFGQMRRPGELSRSYSVGRGPVLPTERPVFSFEGQPSSALWRGEVYDVYTGNAWRSSDASPQPVPVSGGALTLPSFLAGASPESSLSYAVRAEAKLPLILYSPGWIQEAVLPAAAARTLPNGVYIDKFGCIFSPGSMLPAGARYQVVSYPLAPARQSSGPAGSPITASLEELDQSYVRIPLSARSAADLARRVAGDAAAPTDRLARLVAYLQQNCAYTLNAPAVPLGEDAVEHFLFRSRRGYCDLFASALAIMGRAVGVPTRFVTGYAGGQYDPESGRHVMRESDAHAWVEAYVPPYGWMSVDPAPAGGVAPMPPLQKAVLLVRFFFQDRPTLAAALVVILAIALVLGVLVLRRSRASRISLSPDRDDPRTIVLRAYARLSHILRRKGVPRRAAQTPLEYLRSLESGSARASKPPALLPRASLVPIRSLTEIFLAARYGPHPMDIEIAQVALRRLGEARLALRGRARPAERRDVPG